MIISLIAVLSTVFAIEFAIGSRINKKKMLSVGINIFFIGLVLFLLHYFFDISIMTLRYGAMPEIVEGEGAKYATVGAMIIGAIIVLISFIFEQKK